MEKKIKIIRELPRKFRIIKETENSTMASHPSPDFEVDYQKPKLAEFFGI